MLQTLRPLAAVEGGKSGSAVSHKSNSGSAAAVASRSEPKHTAETAKKIGGAAVSASRALRKDVEAKLGGLTDAQKEVNARHLQRYGTRLPTYIYQGAVPTYEGKPMYVTKKPNASCEELIGARPVYVDEHGARYVYPESFPCNAREAAETSKDTQFKQSMALITLLHMHMNSTNAIKRKILRELFTEGANKLMHEKWLDNVGQAVLDEYSASSEPMPSDLPNTREVRDLWFRIVNTPPNSEDIRTKLYISPETGLPAKHTDNTIENYKTGWLGASKLSSEFARLVFEAAMAQLSSFFKDWAETSVPAKLRETTNEVVMIRQQVLLSLSQKMAQYHETDSVDKRILPELVQTLKLARDNTFFHVHNPSIADKKLRDEDAKTATESEERWIHRFKRQTRVAARVNAMFKGEDEIEDRREACEAPKSNKVPGALDDGDAGEFIGNICVPVDIARIKASMVDKYASAEAKLRDMKVSQYWKAVSEELAEENNEGKEFIDALNHPQESTSTLLKDAKRAVKKSMRRLDEED